MIIVTCMKQDKLLLIKWFVAGKRPFRGRSSAVERDPSKFDVGSPILPVRSSNNIGC